MAESINTFIKGLNKDSANTIQPKDSYFDARNIRINTDSTGQSIGGLINVEGNELSFTFPALCNVFTFDITGTAPYTVTLTINAVNYNFSITTTDQADQTQELVNLINADAALTALNIVASVYDCNTVYITSTTPAFSFTLTSVSPEITNITEIIPVLTNFEVIGSTNIRDDIYIMTTSTTGLPGGDGQIWKAVYDRVNNTVVVTIVYNSLLNFTTRHPIQAVGRFETDCTQKLYWTDNYNPLRTINVADTNTFAIPLDIIDLVPTVDHSAVQITNVPQGGNLDTGVYQIIYRQKNVSGGETSFSIPSTLVNIVTADEDGNYEDYIGESSGSNSGKSISFTVNGLDTNYEIVEFVSIYYGTEFSEPVFVSFAQEPVPADGSISLTYSGGEGGSYNLTFGEINALTSGFSHAKSIASKDNRLFAANVTNKKLDYTFDARAYGHEQSSTTFNIDGAAETVFTSIAEDANAINDDYSINKFKRSSTLYGGTGQYVEYEIKTQAIWGDQKELTPGLPGSDYESAPFRFVYSPNPDYNIGQYTHPGFNTQGMRFPNTYGLLKGYQRDEIYRFAIVFFDKKGDPDFAQWIGDIKIPTAFDPLRAGYGVSGYVNGDFRGKLMEQDAGIWKLNIPYIDFTVTLPTDIKNKIGGYSIVRVDRTANDKTILAQGLAHLATSRFPINPGAPNTPSGGVRSATTVLENKDYIFLCNNTEQNPMEPGQYSSTYLYDSAVANPASNAVGTPVVQDDIITVDFPENVFTGGLNYKAGDQLKTVDTMSFNFNSVGTTTFDRNYKVKPSVYENSYQILKYYSPLSTNTPNFTVYNQNLTTDIDEFYRIDKGGSQIMDNGDTFLNETFNVYEGGRAINAAFGEKTILIKTSTPLYDNVAGPIPVIPPFNLNTATNSDAAYIVNYYRPQPNQYGGNTYSQRGSNTYIPTDHYTDIDCDSPLTISSEVFGGDTNLGVMQMQKIIKAWNYNEFTFGPLEPDATPPLYLSRRKSVTKHWPGESTLNIDLRQGRFIDKDDFNDDGTGNDTGEEFILNGLYNRSGNSRLFFPKPAQFQDCNDYYDTRIYASDLKINGENTDSWGSWPINQFIDTESLYGPINNITILNDNMVYHQDSGFGYVAINPRALVTDQSGFGLELGSGSLLQDYSYVSTSIGCKHQWSIITARNAVYWVDINTAKVYRLSGEGTANISDVKGMHSYFRENLTGNVLLNYSNGGDNPLENKGITGFYDPINNEVVFSFHGAHRLQIYTNGVTYYPGDYVINPVGLFTVYYIDTKFTAAGNPAIELAENATDLGASGDFDNAFSIAFSEYTNSFTSFYDYTPKIYVTNNDIILSPNKNNGEDIYRHNVGDYGKFYGTIYNSSLEFISNEGAPITKTFDNLQWHQEVLDYNTDVKNSTFETLRCSNSYQDTGLITLDPTTLKNVKRKERSWHVAVPRATPNRERLRDKTMKVDLSYSNANNYRMLLHFVKTLFRRSVR